MNKSILLWRWVFGDSDEEQIGVGPKLPYRLIRQIGFVGTSVYIFWVGMTCYVDEELIWRPYLIILIFGVYGFAFCLAWLAATSQNLAYWQPLIFLSLLLTFMLRYLVRIFSLPFEPARTDSLLLSDYAAHIFLMGKNPYAWDMSAVFSDYRVSSLFSTPLLDGSEISGLNYPALNFLVFVPLKTFGIEELRIVPVLAFVGIMFLFYRQAPGSFKSLILLPLFINTNYVNFMFGFVTDSVWAFLLIAMLAAWRKPTWRALLFGLACAYKQLPWFLGPFLVIRLWLDNEDPDMRSPQKRVFSFLSISIGTFGLINAPFIIVDAKVWLLSIFEPLYKPLIYHGQGLSTITQFALLNLSKNFYQITALIVLLTLGILYWLNFKLLKEALWIFPGIYMWFSYRSLQSYFIYWPLLFLMSTLNNFRWQMEFGDKKSEILPKPHPYSWYILGIAIAILIIGGNYYAFTTGSLDVDLVGPPTGRSINQLDRLSLSISNTSNNILRPRIAVHNTIVQPYFWHIESGPLSLAPGQSGVYDVTTDLPYRMLNLARGGLVIVTDTSHYTLRGALQIERDISLLNPDAIYNKTYLGPTDAQSLVPWGWGLERVIGDHKEFIPSGASIPSSIGTLSTQQSLIHIDKTADSLPTVTLSFTPEVGQSNWEFFGLSQWIIFPTGDLSAWVKPSVFTPSDQPLSQAYGLEFDDGQHRLWILFGPGTDQGYLSENHYYLYKPASLNIWSHHRINLHTIYTRLGWDLPPLQRIVRGSLELTTRMLTVRLLLAARNQTTSEPLTAQFGPLATESGPNPIRSRIAETVAHQADSYLALGDRDLRQRNYAQAVTHYEAAFTSDSNAAPINDRTSLALAFKGIGWAHLGLGNYTEAQHAFEQAIQYFSPHLKNHLADAYIGMGWILLRQERCREALTYFYQALKFDPYSSQPLEGIRACAGEASQDQHNDVQNGK